MAKFVKTKDKALAQKLRNEGMICIGVENGDTHVFINENLPLKFSDNTNLFFTDKLMF